MNELEQFAKLFGTRAVFASMKPYEVQIGEWVLGKKEEYYFSPDAAYGFTLRNRPEVETMLNKIKPIKKKIETKNKEYLKVHDAIFQISFLNKLNFGTARYGTLEPKDFFNYEENKNQDTYANKILVIYNQNAVVFVANSTWDLNELEKDFVENLDEKLEKRIGAFDL